MVLKAPVLKRVGIAVLCECIQSISFQIATGIWLYARKHSLLHLFFSVQKHVLRIERDAVEVPGDVVALAVRRARRTEEGEALVEEILFNITLSLFEMRIDS